MTSLDSRTWLAWGTACMVPLLMSRHPIIVLQLLLIVIVVRNVAQSQASLGWRRIIRVAIVFAAIGVVFNAFTVRTGNQIAFELAVLEWTITWNAIVYGLVSGLAMITLVFAGVTAAAGLDWIALTRVLPRRLAPLAVSGSVAWSFLPGASQALAEIREAQAARGHAMRSGRDLLPIVVPLLDGSLNRALTMSEALEARGFGAGAEARTEAGRMSVVWVYLLVLGVMLMAYAISLGNGSLAWFSTTAALAGAVGILRSPHVGTRTTRYREHQLQRPDVVVLIAVAVALVAFLAVAFRDPAAIMFNPYPNLELPPLDIAVLIPLTLLLAPALYPARRSAR